MTKVSEIRCWHFSDQSDEAANVGLLRKSGPRLIEVTSENDPERTFDTRVREQRADTNAGGIRCLTFSRRARYGRRVGNSKGIGLAAAPHELAGFIELGNAVVQSERNCFSYRTVSNPSGSALAPSSVKMNGTGCAIDPEMKAPSRDAALAQAIALPSGRAASSVRRSWTRL